MRLSQYHGRMAISCHPAVRSARNELRAGLVRGASLSSASIPVLTANEAASTANTSPGPKMATSTPAAAGPPTEQKLAAELISVLPCWSWFAGMSSGSRPVEAGPKNAWAAPSTAAPAPSSHTVACPVNSSTASTAWTAARKASEESMTNCRGSRSAHTPPTRRNATLVNVPMAIT
jgi:hypothetical protein